MAKAITISSIQDVATQLREAKNLPIPSKEGFIAANQTSLIYIQQSRIKNTHLTGHNQSITAVTLSKAQDLLISCSADKVILWHHSALKTYVAGEHPVCGTTIGVHLGPFTQCAISCNNEWVALSKEHEVWIVHLKWRPTGALGEVEHHDVLPAVTLAGNSSSFSPENPDLLVTVEDSNVFKVWNVRTSLKLYQASVLGSHRITFCSFSSTWPWLLLVGSNRGVVHIFTLKGSSSENSSSTPRLQLTLDLSRCQNNASISTADSEPSRKDSRRRTQHDASSLEESSTEAGCVILNAILVRSDDTAESSTEENDFPDGFNNDDSTLRSILEAGPSLIACSNQGITVYNVNPAECSGYISFSDLSVGNLEAPLPFLDYAVLSGSSTRKVDCVLRSLGGKQAFYFTFQVHSTQAADASAPVTMLARNPVSSNSPLRVYMKPVTTASLASGIYKPGLIDQSKSKRKVQSSGYGLPPRPLNFTPKINGSINAMDKSFLRVSKDTQSLINVRSSKCLMPDRNSDHLKTWKPPLKLETKLMLEEQYGAALHLGMSGDGNQIACSSKKLITVLNANRLNLEDCVSLIGHDNTVNSVAFSLDNVWLVSASDDGSTKVWDWKTKRCVLDMGSYPTWDKKNLTPRTNRGARKKVTQASFYYMDHFVVQAVGSALDLCCHRLHEDGSEILRSSWRRVRRIDLPAQEVTCFSAANRFHSNYLVAGSSNRSLLVYDVDAEKFAISITGAHSRAPHAICALTGSSKIAQPARLLDLVLSSAICDGVKLWDLRTARCVQKYSRHYNRAHLSGIDVSPCCRYVAVASEDKCVYLYDSRQCHDYLCKLGGFTVPVMDVAFSPCKAQLLAAGLNGSILSFSQINKI